MKHLSTLLMIFISSFSFSADAQINAYAKVTGISGTTLSLSGVNQTYHTFNAGDQVIIMQMQDNVAGSNTSNASTFGAVSTIASAGMYEVATISSVAGLPGSITITSATTNTYNFSTSSAVQIISFRKYGSPNYTTTAAISALPWNGSIGGVVAMQVSGTLTVAYPITADGAGFRGGSASSNYEVNCEPGVYASNSSNYGTKGEGIQANATGLLYGRSRLGNGAGGGSDDNGGGGGGSNYSSGGQGGAGWTCTTTPSGGYGGDSIGTYVSKFRVFMGGGGGGGQENNSVGTAGANGGGIIILQANTLTTSCTGAITISASGSAAGNSGNDGSGGGGAGGSIVMSVGTFSVPSSCPLTVNGSGGNGGNVTDPGAHGGGGGGGQGVIMYAAAVPTTNVTSNANNGTGGNNNSTASSVAANGSGTNSQGVMPNMGTITLAVSLTDFGGRIAGTDVLLTWNTKMEQGNDHFNVERSTDGTQFNTIGTVQGAGNSSTPESYSFTDDSPNPGTNFYRLQQVDKDGVAVYSSVVTVGFASAVAATNTTMHIYPNPVTDQFTVQVAGVSAGLGGMDDASYGLAIIDLSGKTVFAMQAVPVNGQIHVVLGQKLVPGIYFLRLSNQQGAMTGKLLMR